ncbi:3-oxoacyl-(acyl-carrier-protein) synthase iii [Leptolyngbya sp. Heron Island J]|uniref:beta-ketoacyl-ACP synthase III n=1 Tax=Leptolyngbya sp. Heron Island J TaxID=1385935 RepID=UPI0003B97DFB|nr:beta-ketoacyl-ACP synthase III [Leptolyngbya sp. Heron Island J]ESA33060.1 3-oxoacyl-(acyl-carrier-protein) synthase iii [Leptolyngbya sp. Heron Island J]
MINGGAGVAFVGSGSARVETELSNEMLSRVVDTSDEWISTRTGICHRHVANADESLTVLAAQAANNAIAAAKLTPEDIDLIILATSTPDDLFGTACQVQATIGATRAVAFDLTAACSGFVFGVVTAAQFIRTGTYQNVVVIGADLLSRWVDWQDRTTCVLFGDGAGAVVMQACDRDRLLGFEMHSDGTMNGCLNLAYTADSAPLTDGVSTQKGTFTAITMNGREVYRFAVSRVPEVLEKTLFHAGLAADDIDWLILHQANQRILDAVAKRLKLPKERVVSNMAQHGNTSAASIPIALDEWVRSDKIQPGDKIAMSGFGAGLTWGAALLEWGL